MGESARLMRPTSRSCKVREREEADKLREIAIILVDETGREIDWRLNCRRAIKISRISSVSRPARRRTEGPRVSDDGRRLVPRRLSRVFVSDDAHRLARSTGLFTRFQNKSRAARPRDSRPRFPPDHLHLWLPADASCRRARARARGARNPLYNNRLTINRRRYLKWIHECDLKRRRADFPTSRLNRRPAICACRSLAEPHGENCYGCDVNCHC